MSGSLAAAGVRGSQADPFNFVHFAGTEPMQFPIGARHHGFLPWLSR